MLLYNFRVIHFRDHTNHLAAKSKKTLNQRFGVLAASIYLIWFVEFLHIFVLVHEKVGCQSPLWICPWKKSTASFLRYSGTLLAESATGKLEDFELSGAASSICMTSLSTSCSDITYILTKNFHSERVVHGKDEMRKFFVFQLCRHFFVLFGGQLTGVVFKDGFHGFA